MCIEILENMKNLTFFLRLRKIYIAQMRNDLGTKCLGTIAQVRNALGTKCPGTNCPGAKCPRYELPRYQLPGYEMP